MLLPPVCPACGRLGEAPCPACRAALAPAPSLPCPPGLDGCAALLDYDGTGRELVARLKYRNARSALPFLARALAPLAAGHPLDVVTWVPTTAARRRGRRFDQAELLARAVARRLGLPCRRLLRREAGPPQTGLDLSSRRAGPSFRPVRRLRAGTAVLLVDDVVTTGATVSAAARALKAAGAARVEAAAAARTRPDRRAAPRRTLPHGRVRVCG